MDWIFQNWQFLAAITGGIVGLWRFLASRRAELSWKRTAFLFDQTKYIETDKDLDEVIKIITNTHPSYTLDDIFDKNSKLKPKERNRLTHILDKFLNVFDRFYYAVHSAKTISFKELCVFGWYLEAVLEHKQLRTYCKENGFENVLLLAEHVVNDS